MKLYMALNETGTSGGTGLHTRLAVLSARRNTDLEPVMLYTGERNDFTRWLESQGVRVIDSVVPYLGEIARLTEEGRYSRATLGHWLRTNVCLHETSDDFVLYTDVDVVFLSNPEVTHLRPRFFSAAPEFKQDCWNYFNAGVMVVNIDGLRSDYEAFERYLVEQIDKLTYGFHDQIAYNNFYRERWNRLPLELNWKPYWGISDEARIIHFHGPKLDLLSRIARGDWDWDSPWERQIASLFAANVAAYRHFIALMIANAPDAPPGDLEFLTALLAQIDAFDPHGVSQKLDLAFTSFTMFDNIQDQPDLDAVTAAADVPPSGAGRPDWLRRLWQARPPG